MKQFIAILIIGLTALPLHAGGIQKNVASQKLTVIAIDSATGRPKTGDAANITAYVSKDDGTLTALTDTSATEISATNAPGKYLFDLAQAETNANKLDFGAKSSTSGVDVFALPSTNYTSPANFQTTSIDSSGGVKLQDDEFQELVSAFWGATKVWWANPNGSNGNGKRPSTGKLLINDAFGLATADVGEAVHAVGDTFDQSTTPVTQKNGVVFRGAGRGVTKITGTPTISDSGQGALFKIGSNTSGMDFTVECTGALPTLRAAIGYQAASPASQTPGRNWVGQRIDAFGSSDGLYLAESNGATNVENTVDMINCSLRSLYDSVMIRGNPGLNTSFTGCQLYSGVGGADDVSIEGRNLLNYGGVCRIHDTSFNIANDADTINVLHVTPIVSGTTDYTHDPITLVTNSAFNVDYKETTGVLSYSYEVANGGQLRLSDVVFDRGVAGLVGGSGSAAYIFDDGALKPTTHARTLDVTATGAGGIDWANVENPTTSNTLSSTTVGTASAIGSGGITSASFGSGAINAAAIASNAFTNAKFATGAFTLDRFSGVFPSNFPSMAVDVSGRLQVQYGTGAGQLNAVAGNVGSNVLFFGGAAGTFNAGVPATNVTQMADGVITDAKVAGDAENAIAAAVAGETPPEEFFENAPEGGGGGGGISDEDLANITERILAARAFKPNPTMTWVLRRDADDGVGSTQMKRKKPTENLKFYADAKPLLADGESILVDSLEIVGSEAIDVTITDVAILNSLIEFRVAEGSAAVGEVSIKFDTSLGQEIEATVPLTVGP